MTEVRFISKIREQLAERFCIQHLSAGIWPIPCACNRTKVHAEDHCAWFIKNKKLTELETDFERKLNVNCP